MPTPYRPRRGSAARSSSRWSTQPANELRADLHYLLATSSELARTSASNARNPSMAGVLTDLEVNDNLRAKFEMEPLNR